MTSAHRFLIAALLVTLAACADRTATAPNFSKVGGGPTVTGTSPTGAPQDTTLDVRVYGSGFDRGSRADLALAGVIGPKVRTNSTRYVSGSELVANVTIAVDADTGAYDVVVTVSSGKKGIGTEMFQVRKGPKPPPPSFNELAPIDLDQGTVSDHHGYGVSDSGWVFVAGDGDPSAKPGLVWLTLTPHDSTVLPAPVSSPRQGNGRGDYLAYAINAVMLRGAAGWTLSPPLPALAGWTSVYVEAVKDSRLVVGHGKDPNGRWTALGWVYDSLAGTWTPVPMLMPAPWTPDCAVGLPGMVGVNDAGVAVAYVYGHALTRKAVCPMRSFVWPSISAAPVMLPEVSTLPGWVYMASDINGRGDITGTMHSGNDYRAVRWRSGTGTAEVLNGFYSFGEAIDECGRVFTSQGYLWEADGTVVTRLVPPTGFPLDNWFRIFDTGSGLAVGEATSSTLGRHALVWTLPACTPAP